MTILNEVTLLWWKFNNLLLLRSPSKNEWAANSLQSGYNILIKFMRKRWWNCPKHKCKNHLKVYFEWNLLVKRTIMSTPWMSFISFLNVAAFMMLLLLLLPLPAAPSPFSTLLRYRIHSFRKFYTILFLRCIFLLFIENEMQTHVRSE